MGKQKKSKIHQVISGMAEIAGYLWERGWAERNAGNISVNITQLTGMEEAMKGKITGTAGEPLRIAGITIPAGLKGQVLLVTAMGTRMRDLAKQPEENLCMVYVTARGAGYYRSFSGNGRRPTSELPTHLAIHEFLLRHRPGEKAVVHAHVLELIALTHYPRFRSAEEISRILRKMHPEMQLFLPGGAGYIPFTVPGTEKIAHATVKEFRDHPAVIWEKHGALATGTTAADAFDILDILAKAARIWLLCRSAGFDPEGLKE